MIFGFQTLLFNDRFFCSIIFKRNCFRLISKVAGDNLNNALEILDLHMSLRLYSELKDDNEI